MTIELAPRLIVIGPLRQIVAVVHRRDRARQRQDLEPVTRELELADDLRAQQAHDVGELRTAIARNDFLGHRGAADDLAPLEDHDLLARAREIRAGDQAVMARADHDRIVLIGCHGRVMSYVFFQAGS